MICDMKLCYFFIVFPAHTVAREDLDGMVVRRRENGSDFVSSNKNSNLRKKSRETKPLEFHSASCASFPPPPLYLPPLLPLRLINLSTHTHTHTHTPPLEFRIQPSLLLPPPPSLIRTRPPSTSAHYLFLISLPPA